MDPAADGDRWSSNRTGQIPLQMQIDRARDMPLPIGLFTGTGVRKPETGIHHTEIGLSQCLRQIRGFDQCRE